jgi:hypothetical protein
LWLPIGALIGIGVAAMMSIGVFLLGVATVLMLLLLWAAPSSRFGVAGMLTGAAAAPALIAWLNRDGPGDVCHALSNGQVCTQESTPVPFGIAAALMAGGGWWLFARAQRRRLARPSAQDAGPGPCGPDLA